MIADENSMTLRQAVCGARDRLAGVADLAATAARDAELLLLHALSLPRTTIYAYPGRLLNGEEQAAFAAAIDRRLAREPVQYIIGRQEFYGIPLEVTSAVLIPRPETELLVEAVLDRLPSSPDLRIADVGTGSGAIAIALALRRPDITLTAIDLAADALKVAARNAAAHRVADRIQFLQSDLFAALQSTELRFDVVVANPPYIPAGDRASLHTQVRDFEPSSALFAGADGMAVFRELIPQAWSYLRDGGLLAMECGAGQAEALTHLLHDWKKVRFLEDLQAIPRVVLARRS